MRGRRAGPLLAGCAASVAVVTSGYPMGAMMTSVVAGFIMPEFGWRGMFWFGGGLTLSMTLVALWLMPESLSYLLHRRPAGALQRINKILSRLGSSPVSELPATGDSTASRPAGIAETMLSLLFVRR